ncbi:MAG: beta-N-acetylglucosaminidase domain-containing protein [Clostridia bacterium]|nr:beta-N-acetylglucosaminidase domain-containing protein [Clostridia bacterium]
MRQVTLCGGTAALNSVCYELKAKSGEAFAADGFVAEISAEKTVVYADRARERAWAEAELSRMAEGGEIPCGKYVYRADFKVRGIIEGFYGKPWTMDSRRKLLHALSRHGMNEYFYGPKDDPYHRDRWRECYGEGDDAVLKELISIASANDMEFRYMLAPGLDIRYTSEADLQALAAKYRQVWSFGVKRFGLLLDDLESATMYEEDAAVYPRQVDAHIALTNRVWRDLQAIDPEISLIVCPTQYWGDVYGPYIHALGQGIPAEVELFFTGSRICSDRLTRKEAEDFIDSTGHAPIYWDNYPVNDMEMIDEMHLMPYTGREPSLAAVCGGIVLNPMEYATASLIPLLCAADFLANAEEYDPAKSFDGAVTEVLGAEFVESVRRFAELGWRSCLTKSGHHFRYDAEDGCNLLFETAFAAGKDALIAYARETAELLAKLENADAGFVAEVRRWLDTARTFADALLASCESGDPAALRAYLSRTEALMKPEAYRVICSL